jgi:hypothetical protein
VTIARRHVTPFRTILVDMSSTQPALFRHPTRADWFVVEYADLAHRPWVAFPATSNGWHQRTEITAPVALRAARVRAPDVAYVARETGWPGLDAYR